MGDTQHAFLPPSGAGAWVECAAWPSMNSKYPRPDDDATLEGNAAHWVFVELFFARVVSVGQVAPNGVVLTEEIIEGAECYGEAVDARLNELGLNRSSLIIDRTLRVPRVHPVHNYGAPGAGGGARGRGGGD